MSAETKQRQRFFNSPTWVWQMSWSWMQNKNLCVKFEKAAKMWINGNPHTEIWCCCCRSPFSSLQCWVHTRPPQTSDHCCHCKACSHTKKEKLTARSKRPGDSDCWSNTGHGESFALQHPEEAQEAVFFFFCFMPDDQLLFYSPQSQKWMKNLTGHRRNTIKKGTEPRLIKTSCLSETERLCRWQMCISLTEGIVVLTGRSSEYVRLFHALCHQMLLFDGSIEQFF